MSKSPGSHDDAAKVMWFARPVEVVNHEDPLMPKFMFHGNYSSAGNQAVLADGGTSRHRVAAALAESLGGSLESFHYVLGGDEAVSICDLPSIEAATALALTICAGGVAELRTIALLTPSEVDAATKLSPVYRSPGA
jgi:uncharacterized protein with GYD domain